VRQMKWRRLTFFVTAFALIGLIAVLLLVFRGRHLSFSDRFKRLRGDMTHKDVEAILGDATHPLGGDDEREWAEVWEEVDGLHEIRIVFGDYGLIVKEKQLCLRNPSTGNREVLEEATYNPGERTLLRDLLYWIRDALRW